MRYWRTCAIPALIVINMAAFTTVAHADCYYKGQRYSDGAINDAGQVCDGRSGTWK